MKNYLYIFALIFVVACDSENAGDCFQKTGAIIQQEFAVDAFSKILVNRDIELVVKQGTEQKVVVETGENLINDVTAVVDNGQLILTDNNTCNYVRDYGVTKIYITSPNITEIRSSTQYDISSDGILTYPSLTLLSESFSAPETFTSANFKLQVDNNILRIVFNNASNCYISGQTNNLNVTFASGTSRFEGEELVAQNITIWNRSSNDMILNPQQSIKGKISGVGNVIAVTKPDIIEVIEEYKGRLIFK